MIEIKQTSIFKKWRSQLKDDHVRALIASRIDRLTFGHLGDSKSVGCGLSELRIHYGPGYRIYFKKIRNTLVILLCGGNKSTQEKDIKIARRLSNSLE